MAITRTKTVRGTDRALRTFYPKKNFYTLKRAGKKPVAIKIKKPVSNPVKKPLSKPKVAPKAVLKQAPKAIPFKPPAAQPPLFQVPQQAALPFNANYETQINQADTNLGETQASLNAQRLRLQNDYGIDDTSNPFSRMQQLRDQLQRNQAFNQNSYASRGHLYSGALQQARDETTRGFQQGQDSLERSYQSALADFALRQREAIQQSLDRKSEIERQRVADAAANRPEADEAPIGPDTAPEFGGFSQDDWRKILQATAKSKPKPPPKPKPKPTSSKPVVQKIPGGTRTIDPRSGNTTIRQNGKTYVFKTKR